MVNSDISILNVFLGFLSAFIVKDFYDILISDHIRKWLKKYKLLIVKEVKDETTK